MTPQNRKKTTTRMTSLYSRLMTIFFNKGITTLKVWLTFTLILLTAFLLNISILNTELKAKVLDLGWGSRKAVPKRGTIYDRNGHDLAVSNLSRNVVAVRKRIDPGMYDILADFLDPHLSKTKKEIVELLNESDYEIKLVEGLTEQEYNDFCRFRLIDWKTELDNYLQKNPDVLSGFRNQNDFFVKFEKAFQEIVPRKSYSRIYPRGRMTSHVVGYSSNVNDNFRPWKGLELVYNDLLEGVEGDIRERRDTSRNLIPGFTPVERGLIPGWELRVTLSSEIQALAYNTLKERINSTGAKGGCIIVLDSPTAEILAMVSYPDFDPDNYQEYISLGPESPDLLSKEEYRLNPMHNLATQLAFEPGSVMKPIIAAWALEHNIIDRDDLFKIDPNGLPVPGKPEPIRDTHPPDKTQMWKIFDLVVHSSNAGMAQVGIKMGRENIVSSLKNFHFGQRVLDFGEERKGLINENLREVYLDRPSWSMVREANVAFGKGIAVTPLQLIAAMNVFANNGYYVRPRIVLDASSIQRETLFFNQPERERIISDEVLSTMQDILESVVIKGTATQAQCKGYRVMGKTGTSEKLDHVNGGYYKNRHYASFVGFGPLPDPRYTILVLLDEPKTRWGGYSCGPAFKTIFENLMIKDGIPPNNANEFEST